MFSCGGEPGPIALDAMVSFCGVVTNRSYHGYLAAKANVQKLSTSWPCMIYVHVIAGIAEGDMKCKPSNSVISTAPVNEH